MEEFDDFESSFDYEYMYPYEISPVSMEYGNDFGYKNFYTNTSKKNVPMFKASAKFAGIKIIVREKAYSMSGVLISEYSAIIWGTVKRSKKQNRLFKLYFDGLRDLFGYS